MGLGFSEIVLIVLVVILLFGAKRIPELAKAFGRASYEFKKAKESLEQESAELIAAAEKNAEAESKAEAAAAAAAADEEK